MGQLLEEALRLTDGGGGGNLLVGNHGDDGLFQRGSGCLRGKGLALRLRGGFALRLGLTRLVLLRAVIALALHGRGTLGGISSRDGIRHSGSSFHSGCFHRGFDLRFYLHLGGLFLHGLGLCWLRLRLGLGLRLHGFGLRLRLGSGLGRFHLHGGQQIRQRVVFFDFLFHLMERQAELAGL